MDKTVFIAKLEGLQTYFKEQTISFLGHFTKPHDTAIPTAKGIVDAYRNDGNLLSSEIYKIFASPRTSFFADFMRLVFHYDSFTRSEPILEEGLSKIFGDHTRRLLGDAPAPPPPPVLLTTLTQTVKEACSPSSSSKSEGSGTSIVKTMKGSPVNSVHSESSSPRSSILKDKGGKSIPINHESSLPREGSDSITSAAAAAAAVPNASVVAASAVAACIFGAQLTFVGTLFVLTHIVEPKLTVEMWGFLDSIWGLPLPPVIPMDTSNLDAIAPNGDSSVPAKDSLPVDSKEDELPSYNSWHKTSLVIAIFAGVAFIIIKVMGGGPAGA